MSRCLVQLYKDQKHTCCGQSATQVGNAQDAKGDGCRVSRGGRGGRGEFLGRTPLVASRLPFSVPPDLPSRAKDPVAPPQASLSGGMTRPDQTWPRPDLISTRLDLDAWRADLISPARWSDWFLCLPVLSLQSAPPSTRFLFLKSPLWLIHCNKVWKIGDSGLFNPAVHNGYHLDFRNSKSPVEW